MKYLFILSFLFIGTVSFGQTKIGYTNVELILAYMPEAKAMETQVQTFQQKLGEKLQIKQNYAQTKLQEYQVWMQNTPDPPAAEKQAKESELMKLDEEIQKLASQSEYDLLNKRQELLEPILKKLQTALDEVSAELGYTYILNQTTSAGVSTILFGPDDHDITEAVMKKLGIEIPSGNQ